MSETPCMTAVGQHIKNVLQEFERTVEGSPEEESGILKCQAAGELLADVEMGKPCGLPICAVCGAS